ncbi:MAG: UvrD-helicase domain-containing protein [Solirubrobacteraceae bacterium]
MRLTHPIAGVPPPLPAAGELLAGLTSEQAAAVTHGSGPLLLLAGPGAGKTKTLTHRAAYLIATGRARPWEILAVTFSVRAAGELRLRLADLLGETVARAVTAATFHSVCARLLREHASVFGRTERYTIYDQGDMRRVVDWLLSDAERGQIQRALRDHGQPASAEVLAEISRAKNLLLTHETYERPAAHPAALLIAAVWRESERELQRSNAMDFDDLLAFAVRLLAEHPHRLAWLRQRWRWILVDEYQDTSCAQATLVDLLAGPDGNLCVVGDDDQLIHGWRHADPKHILGFAERHPAREEIVLGRNFRSRAEILEAAVVAFSTTSTAPRRG